MTFFVGAYAVGVLLWVSQGGRHPWILLYVLLAVSLWVALYIRHRRSRPR